MNSKVRSIKTKSLQHDGQLTLAVAPSRASTSWRNHEVEWSALVARLEEPTRTTETMAAYRALSRLQQTIKKDVGGFVGGVLKGGRRVATAVAWRQLLTLDADYADEALLFDLRNSVDYGWCFYSTRGHGVKEGVIRLRVLIPLSRPVKPEEYQAIGRRVAADLGIEKFDDTTYEPHRLMFWPSVAQDQEYLYEYLDQPWIDADAVLARYDDWHDAALWPSSQRVPAQHKRAMTKAGDPLEKKGLIGAFCRAHTIEEAIQEYLSDVYEPGHGERRYTYREGSTANGLVVYDEGRFAFSNHGTDPLSGQLVNAWDMVRLHRFGSLDDDTGEDVPINKRPSTIAMQEWASSQPDVRRQLAKERRAEAEADFSATRATAGVGGAGADAEEPGEDDWAIRLELDRQGRIIVSRDNYLLILLHDPKIKGRLAFNALTETPCVAGVTPWDSRSETREWTDTDDAGLLHYLEQTYRVPPPIRVVADAQRLAWALNLFHPVRDYLELLEWDGQARLDTLLIDYLGAEDSLYTRAVGRKTLTAAVARVMEPGCKFDSMLLLVGPQGTGKSTLLSILGRPWFSDSLYTVQGKDAYEAVRGAWIIEVAELSATRRADVEAVKHFISKTSDRYREAYGRHQHTYARQCIFVGTTNAMTPLSDDTGNRRFWPVPVAGVADVPGMLRRLGQVRDQIWAEAVWAYRLGEDLYLSAEEARQAEEQQEAHRSDSGLADSIRVWLDKPVPADWYQRSLDERLSALGSDFGHAGETILRDRVCAREVWVEMLREREAMLFAGKVREINQAIKSLGWKKQAIRNKAYGVGVIKGWVRPGYDSGESYSDCPF